MKEDWSILEWSFYLFELSKHKASNVASWTSKKSGRKQEILKFATDRRIDSLFSFIVTSLYVRLYVMWVRMAREKKTVIARVIAGVCFSHSFMRFAGGLLALVRKARVDCRGLGTRVALLNSKTNRNSNSKSISQTNTVESELVPRTRELVRERTVELVPVASVFT